jgi:hypothetical protein
MEPSLELKAQYILFFLKKSRKKQQKKVAHSSDCIYAKNIIVANRGVFQNKKILFSYCVKSIFHV